MLRYSEEKIVHKKEEKLFIKLSGCKFVIDAGRSHSSQLPVYQSLSIYRIVCLGYNVVIYHIVVSRKAVGQKCM